MIICANIANPSAGNNPVAIVNPLVITSGIEFTTFSIAVLPNKNPAATDVYKRQVESIADAYKLAENCSQIKSLNLGGTKPREGTRNVSKAINVTKEEEQMIKELIDKGIDVEIRMVPNDTSIDAKTVIE